MLWATVLVTTVGVGLGLPAWTQAHDAARYPVAAGDLAAARSALAALPVKGRAPTTGYDRAAFGQAWGRSESQRLRYAQRRARA